MTTTTSRIQRIIQVMALILSLSFMAATANAQIISQFDFDSNPVTKASIGPNATSIGANATSSTGGVGGSNGLNAVNGDIAMTIASPASAVFNVSGIDISVDFKRKESVANFYTRGSNIDFGMNGGTLAAKFLVSDGGSGSVTINSGSVYTLPNDNLFHRYRMIYDDVAGRLTIYVDGTQVYSYQGTANRPLYNTGAGNLVIGLNMDGGNNNFPVLDNFLVAKPSTTLPVTLIDFNGMYHEKRVILNWKTANEKDFSRFVVERSADATRFASINTVAASGSDNATADYAVEDAHPISGRSYYRLKMIDIDGRFSYSNIIPLQTGGQGSVSIFPVPAKDKINITLPAGASGKYNLTLLDMSAKPLRTTTIEAGSAAMVFDLPGGLQPGAYILRVVNVQTGSAEVAKVSVF